jgi:hypothetical protein
MVRKVFRESLELGTQGSRQELSARVGYAQSLSQVGSDPVAAVERQIVELESSSWSGAWTSAWAWVWSVALVRRPC